MCPEYLARLTLVQLCSRALGALLIEGALVGCLLTLKDVLVLVPIMCEYVTLNGRSLSAR